MNGLEITKELKNDIEANQIRLQNAICNHQALVHKAKDLCNDDKESISKAIKEAEQDIIQIGLEQRGLLERLREEYKSYQKSLKNQVIKTALEERRTTLTTSLNRARKQNLLPRTRTSPSNSLSDESEQRQSSPIYQEDNPVVPQDLAQPDFLAYFRLTTHEIFVEMQKKRAERKRRSTANPQFLYGNKGWDWGPPMKKKRNHFLAHPPSPPNTRGRKKQEMAIMARVKSPSLEKNKSAVEKSINNNSNIESKTDLKPIINPFPSIPNLPSGLIIERISPGSTSPDSKQCIVCKQPGALSICEQCSNGFHMSCHNRPFARTPKECPKCLLAKERLLSGSSTRSTSSSSSSCSGMTISYYSPTEISEKLEIKQELQEKRKDLVAELTQLQNRHSELTISLKNQEIKNEGLKISNKATEDKVNKLIDLIESVKNFTLPEECNS